MIVEDYINFDIAKLLKDKGFDEKYVKVWYDESGEMYYDRHEIKYQIKIENHGKFFQCPTLQMVVKWLWENYNLYVMAYPWKGGDDVMTTRWCCKVYDSYNLLGYEKFTDETPKSCEDAYESGIKYCLTKLI